MLLNHREMTAESVITIVDRKYHLAEIIPPNIMQEISEMFFNVVGINIIFIDNRAVPISPPLGSFPRWCQRHFEVRNLFIECLRCFEKGLKNSFTAECSQIYQGHCGQTLMSAPLYAKSNVLLGCLITGPVQLQETPSQPPAVEQVAEEFRTVLDSIPRITGDKLRAVAKLISTLANYLTVAESLSRYQQELVLYQQRLLEEAEKTATLEKEIVDYKLVLKEAEVRELQAKMNPHFLFNALNTIARLAYEEEAVETEKAIFALADIARYGIDGKVETVLLETELQHVASYLYIQQIRFGSRVKVEIKVNRRHGKVKILPYTIQPLIENAFHHGLESVSGNRNLIIRTEEDLEGDRLLIHIIDDGVGIDAARFTRDGWCHSPGTNLENIHQRLRNFFGSQYGLKIQGPPLINGTQVTLIVPMQTHKNKAV